MSKAEEIQSIITQRQPLADQLGEIESALISLHDSISTLKEERQHQIEYWSEDSDTQAKLNNLDFFNFEQQVPERLELLHRLQKRFARKTLNIGVIGRMGQGKSTLLQSLSGLKNEVIPALQGKACTAARSTICHQEDSSTTAEIEFHSQQSFLLEVIIPYYEKLGLKPLPNSFKEFAHSSLPDLPPNADQTQVNIYHRLKDDYYNYAKEYQDLLGQGYFPIKDSSQISSYVASQYNENEELLNHQCLAVKHVKISCPFPDPDVGAIALVDVPGLGDFRLGDESLVIEALAQEVDFILFIRKPSKDRANFEQNDTQLYQLANQALNDLPSRSIFVLNVDQNGENLQSCQSLKRDLDSGKVKIPVLDCVIANCSSPDEAQSKVLQTVLENLRLNVTTLDRNYTTKKLEDLGASIDELNQQLQLAHEALPDIDNDEIYDEFDNLFEDFWTKITNELTILLDKLIEDRDLPDQNLQNQITEVLEKCRENPKMPTVKDIESRRNTLGDYASTYSEYLRKLRTNLSSRFLDIDEGLKLSIEKVKAEVADVLAENCSLRGLSETSGEEFLVEVAKQIPPQYSELKKGFEILSDFNLSYRGLIQHRIRLQLDRLTPDKTARLVIPDEKERQKSEPEYVLEALEELYKETIYNCENALNGFLSEPNQASFAIVEEFVDRIVRAESSKKEWRKFLRRKKSQIWQNFNKMQKKVETKREWSRFLETAENQAEQLNDFLQSL